MRSRYHVYDKERAHFVTSTTVAWAADLHYGVAM
jgi:hypothetical protein